MGRPLVLAVLAAVVMSPAHAGDDTSRFPIREARKDKPPASLLASPARQAYAASSRDEGGVSIALTPKTAAVVACQRYGKAHDESGMKAKANIVEIGLRTGF